MTDDEWIALIGGIALVVGGILSAIGLLIKSTFDSGHLKDQVEQIRHQVQKTHEKNLSDEIDEIKDGLRSLTVSVAANTDRLAGIDSQVTELRQSAFRTAFDRIRHPLGGDKTQETP